MNKYIVVIDMQNDFVTGPLGSKEAEKVADRIHKYFSEQLVPTIVDGIIYTKDTHFDNYLFTSEGKYLPVPHCIKNTEGWMIADKVMHYPGSDNKEIKKTVIEKNTFGSLNLVSFFVKELSKNALYESDLDIVLCGVCTDICVVSNALLLKASFPEANITVLENLCAGTTKEKHEAALSTMNSCQINIVKAGV